MELSRRCGLADFSGKYLSAKWNQSETAGHNTGEGTSPPPTGANR